MNAILSEKGQVTIPKALREAMGMVTGTVLSFSEKEGKLVVSKVLPKDPIAKWRGKGLIPKGESVDGYLTRIRDGK
jgi:AbrB family looped-hinge helix DNA binding protein